jgi:diguanylate cyclase (GGDEF)-like protein
MRLGDGGPDRDTALRRDHRLTPGLTWAISLATLVVIFTVDRLTSSAPVQHLYYGPIALVAYRLGRRAGLFFAIAAVALYHFANHHWLETPIAREGDALQIAVFFAVALALAKIGADADHLRRLATTDDLTGLHNLRSFKLALTLSADAVRTKGEPVSMLSLDLDRLKQINDRFGHLAGASAVQLVGREIARLAPPGAVACRYGGDEFAILLPGFDLGQAHAFAVELCQAVHALTPVLAGQVLTPGALAVSIGVAQLGEGDGESLFRGADEALYQAKREGRNRVATFTAPEYRADETSSRPLSR